MLQHADERSPAGEIRVGLFCACDSGHMLLETKFKMANYTDKAKI
jgi:hypothetical protein